MGNMAHRSSSDRAAGLRPQPSVFAEQHPLRGAIRNLFRRRNPARELALLGIEKRRRSVCEVAQQIRDELGLPPSSALSRRT